MENENQEKTAPGIEEIAGQLRDGVVSFVDRNPYGAIGIAFGAGYLLSGALVSRTTGRLLMFGGRFLIGGLVKSLIAGGALGALAPLVQEMTAEPSSSPSPSPSMET